jgi:hypothetical protein
MPRSTHTYVTLEISAEAWDEIASKMRDAQYDHCFGTEGEIDMDRIALVKEEAKS